MNAVIEEICATPDCGQVAMDALVLAFGGQDAMGIAAAEFVHAAIQKVTQEGGGTEHAMIECCILGMKVGWMLRDSEVAQQRLAREEAPE